MLFSILSLRKIFQDYYIGVIIPYIFPFQLRVRATPLAPQFDPHNLAMPPTDSQPLEYTVPSSRILKIYKIKSNYLTGQIRFTIFPSRTTKQSNSSPKNPPLNFCIPTDTELEQPSNAKNDCRKNKNSTCSTVPAPRNKSEGGGLGVPRVSRAARRALFKF